MSMGPMQILIIVAIVLLFFGPKRLPGLAKSLGESIRGFKKSLNDDETKDVTNSVASERIDQNEKSEDITKAKSSEKEKS